MLHLLKSFAPLTLYIGWLVTIMMSMSGNVLPGIQLLIPLFPLQNVIERMHRLPLGKDLNDFLLIAMTFGWIIARSSRGERIMDRTPLNGLLILYFLYTLITLLLGSVYLHTSSIFSIGDVRVQMWKNYVVFLLVYFLVVNNVREPAQMKKLFWLMLLSMLIMDYYTVPQIRWMSSIVSRTKLHGTFLNLGPNELSAFYATYPFVLLGVMLFEKQPIRKFALGFLIWVAVFCVLFMYSRGAYLAVLAGTLVLALFRYRILLVPLIVLIVCWQVLLPPSVVERIKQTESVDNTLDASAAKRLDIWQDAISMFKKSPVVGVGFATLAVTGLRYGFADPHNIYLKMLTEQGIIGLGFLLIIFGISFYSGFRLYSRAEDGFLKGLGLGFMCCVAGTMVGNLFGNRWTHQQLGAFYWVFLALVVRGNMIKPEKKRGKEKRHRAQRPSIDQQYGVLRG